MPRAHEVVSNTSPLLHLHRLERLDLLQFLYGRVLVPPAVLEEIEAGKRKGIQVPSPESLAWIQVLSPEAAFLARVPESLGLGEREVLALALQRAARLVVLDDKAARRFASTRGIRLTGTLGVLLRGKREGRIEAVLPLIDRLEEEGFRLHPRTRAAVLAICGEG